MKTVAHSVDQQEATATILLIPAKQIGVAKTESADLEDVAYGIVDVLIEG